MSSIKTEQERDSRPEFLNFRDAHVAMAGQRYTVITPRRTLLINLKK